MKRNNIEIDFVKQNKNTYIADMINSSKINWLLTEDFELIELKTEQKNYYIPVFNEVYQITVLLNEELAEDVKNTLISFLLEYFNSADYIKIKDYKLNLTEKINRKFKFKVFKRMLFQYGENNFSKYLRILGIKIKLKKKTCSLEINKNTKCLMVCPHPDDELFGAGALMVKYSNNFDCLCMGSSGVATPDIGAKERSELRVREFNEVMDTIGIKNRWIFETYGKPRFDRQMDEHFNEYCETLKNLKDYDYIFLPHPQDGHHEHRYITNKLFKKIAKKVGVNPKTKIVFYEVWSLMKHPNVFFDTSSNGELYTKNGLKKYQPANSKLLNETTKSLLEIKYDLLSKYQSQWRYNSYFYTATMKKCLENGKNPVWKFKVVSIKKYL